MSAANTGPAAGSSLPMYAIVGAQKGVAVGLPVLGVLALAVIGPTAGRWYVVEHPAPDTGS